MRKLEKRRENQPSLLSQVRTSAGNLWNRFRTAFVRGSSLISSDIFRVFNITGSGRTVNTQDVLRSTGAWRCLTLLGESIARIEKQVLVKADRGFVADYDHYLLDVLEYPSRFYSGFVFYETMTGLTALYGNGYALILRDGRGIPYEFVILHPTDVEPVLTPEGDFYYRVQFMSGLRTVDPMDILHLTSRVYDSPYSLQGMNTMKIHGDTFRLTSAAADYSVNFFENGAHLQGYLHTAEHLSAKEVSSIKGEFDASVTGVSNTAGTPVLHSGLDYKVVKLTPKDAMFIEVSALTLADQSRIFGVPLHMLSTLERTTFNNIETQGFEFIEYTLEPWALRWQAELQLKLIPLRNRRKSKIKFNTSRLGAGDSEARANYYLKLFNAGAMSPNDIRMAEGLVPREGGDTYYTPVNTFTDVERDKRMEKQDADIEALLNQADNGNQQPGEENLQSGAQE